MTNKITGLLGWAIVIAVSLYFINDSALNYFNYDQDHYGGAWPFAPFLLMHIVFGMIALLLGPFQFFPSIRKKYVKTHHTIGKIYLCAILLAGSASLYLAVAKILAVDHAPTFGIGLMGLALAWFLTAGMAYWSVRHKNFVQHREWMVRSYVVTTAFASFRLFFKVLTEDFHTDPNATGDIVAWACWAFPLMVTEVVLQAIKIRRGFQAITKRQQKQAISAV